MNRNLARCSARVARSSELWIEKLTGKLTEKPTESFTSRASTSGTASHTKTCLHGSRQATSASASSRTAQVLDKLTKHEHTRATSFPRQHDDVRRHRSLPTRSALPVLSALPNPKTIRTALAYHVASLYERHHKAFLTFTSLTLAYATFKSTNSLAGLVVDLETSNAAFAVSLTAALSVILASLGFYLRHCTINTDAVYRKAMLQLNAHPGVLEVMGAPVAGGAVRGSVLQGGGLVVDGDTGRLRMAPKKVDMVWRLIGGHGSSAGVERAHGGGLVGGVPLGLVSLQAAKEGGILRFKVMALDVARGESEDRVYIVGGMREYEESDVLDGLKRVVKEQVQQRSW